MASLKTLVLLLIVYCVSADELQELRYEAPDDCQWYLRENKEEVALTCKLRTINSEFDTTNFSVIPSEHTTSLRIECNDAIMSKSNLGERSFQHLTRLRELAIDGCKLGKWGVDTLGGLKDLRNLTVRTRNVDWPVMSLELTPESLTHVRGLERLDLSTNNMWSFPDAIFCPLSNLIALNLSMNRLQDVSDLGFRERVSQERGPQERGPQERGTQERGPQERSFQERGPQEKDLRSGGLRDSSTGIDKSGLRDSSTGIDKSGLRDSSSGIDSPDLNSLRLSSGLIDLEEGLEGQKGALGTECPLNIQILDTSYNHFVLIPSGGFSRLRRLTELYIHSNEISMVGDGALSALKTLKIVDLSSNKLVALPKDLFKDCAGSIEEIYLQNNSISVLAPGLFSNLERLMALDLSKNQLTNAWINGETFSGLIRLVLLNLGHNRISQLNVDFFKDLYTLQILNLEHNGVEMIPAETFAPMSNLHTLILSFNKITYLDAYSLNGLYVLSLLSLDNNRLEGLHPEALRNCSGLQDLNLNGNALKSIPLALKNMRLLKTVDLGENQIARLEPGFSGLPSLYGLRLIGNHLESIEKGAFDELPSLQILNLARNRIRKVQRGTFDLAPNLQAIRLDANRLQNMEGLFGEVASLLWLNVSDNNLETFDLSMVPRGLQWVDLHKNAIGELTNHYGLDLEALHTLDLSFNRLRKVGPKGLPSSLEALFLNDNLITQVEPYTFLNKPNLTRVDLYANQITNMDLNALRLTSVEPERPLPEFYIGGNPFLCDCKMEWLQRVNQLGLRSHPHVVDLDGVYCRLRFKEGDFVPLLEALPSQFLCAYKTHCFALCQCCEFDACDCEMTCPQNCTCYHDQSWSSNVVECSQGGYQDLPRIPMDATEVYLDGNQLGELNSHVFIGRKNLKVLYLNGSNINALYNDTFAGLRRLSQLHLESNHIERLEGYEFASLENLRELYLQGNHLKFIHEGVFRLLRHLEVLRLENNRLRDFPVWELSVAPYLVEIGLGENPWSCKCDFLERFRPWLQVNLAKVVDGRRLTCGELRPPDLSSLRLPSGLRDSSSGIDASRLRGSGSEIDLSGFGGLSGRPLSDFNVSCEVYAVFSGERPHPSILPLFLGALFVFLCAVTLVCGGFYYRRELRVWIYSHCGLRMCYKASTFEESRDKDRLYDAYLSYSIKDTSFINQILSPGLESEGYRLCLHYRDFNVSTYVADTILEAVESSRRTILVLSKNFLNNEWCRFEFKSALHEVLKDRRRKLIIIVTGELPPRDLDPDLRLYLKTNTVIECGDRQFWQKLRFAMPDVRRGVQRSSMNIYASGYGVGPGVGGMNGLDRARSPIGIPLPPQVSKGQFLQHGSVGDINGQFWT